MNKDLKDFIISTYNLKSDSTDKEVQAYIDKNKIVVLDKKTPAAPQEPVASSNNDDFKAELKTVKDELDMQIAGMEQTIATLNLNIQDNVEKDPMLGFKSGADFFMDVMAAGKTGKPSDRLMKAHQIRIKNAIGSDEAKVSNDPDGGFLIPTAIFPEVQKTDGQALQMDTGSRTRNIPMATNLVSINARVDKNHSSSVSGGFQVYRRAETETVTATKAQFEQIDLKADSLMGIAYASKEILDLSPISFAALINSGFADEKISKLNNERLRGTGVGEYLGILNSPALVTQDEESGQAPDTIVGENLINMRSRIWGYNNAIWMFNLDCYPALVNAHITGTNGDIFLFHPGNGIDVPDTILGRPVFFDENMGTLGDLGDSVLANWSEFLEGQVGGASFADSVHVRFIYNETAFKFDIMNAGAPWWRTALTPKKSAATLSPFVTLAARA